MHTYFIVDINVLRVCESLYEVQFHSQFKFCKSDATFPTFTTCMI